MTPMGFNRWTDTNETFPYLKRKRIIVVMLFLFFFLLFILCMCVFFTMLVSFIFIYLFIHLFIAGEPYTSPQTLLYNSEKKPV